jgi:heme exporter protein B
MVSGFCLMLKRECLLTWRRPVEWLNPLLFFILVAVLFPLTMTPSIKILQQIGPGVIWVAILLAILMSLPRLFQPDYEDGSLEQWLLGAYPLSLLVFAKVAAQWIMLSLPLLFMTPLIALMFHLTWQVTQILIFSLLLGTPLLTLLGSIGAALIVGLRQSGLLLALILLPLYIPALIFATAALNAATAGISPTASLLWLSALLSLALVLAPWVSAATLKIGIAYR